MIFLCLLWHPGFTRYSRMDLPYYLVSCFEIKLWNSNPSREKIQCWNKQGCKNHPPSIPSFKSIALDPDLKFGRRTRSRAKTNSHRPQLAMPGSRGLQARQVPLILFSPNNNNNLTHSTKVPTNWRHQWNCVNYHNIIASKEYSYVVQLLLSACVLLGLFVSLASPWHRCISTSVSELNYPHKLITIARCCLSVCSCDHPSSGPQLQKHSSTWRDSWSSC